MKQYTTLLMAALLGLPAFASSSDPALAGNASADFASLPATSRERIHGSLTAGYDSSYVGRGIPCNRDITEGDGSEFGALKFNYDFGNKKYWSWDGTILYRAVSSGHTLYGNPTYGHDYVYSQAYPIGYAIATAPYGYQVSPGVYGMGLPAGSAAASMAADSIANQTYETKYKGKPIKTANIENEFVVQNAIKYTRDYWNIACGHTFVHGGMLGIMAKHYRDQSASCVNEVFMRPEVTPTKWLSIGCDVRYSFQGITGWWFIPDVTFKAPIIGTPEDVKLAGVVQFGMSAAADYFQGEYFACDNGTEAFWIKLSAPWFIRKNIILTPSVSFNWLGKDAHMARRMSEYRKVSGYDGNVPFDSFRVIGGVMITYTF